MTHPSHPKVPASSLLNDTQKNSSQRTVYSVSKLNQSIKTLLLNSMEPLWVCGEVSNLAHPPSGHLYFSLKDEAAQIHCAMFQSRNARMNWKVENGMLVLAYARVDLYANRGAMQLIVDKMEKAGDGDLQQRFEALKKKLAKEGLFDQAHKQNIPPYPCRIGIVTSPQSAAMADIMKIFLEYANHAHTIIYPTLVQGQTAAASLVEALQLAEARQEVEVLIIARGGGSLEDLQAFNDEQVVRAIAACTIPTISGVGHDIDFTLTDFAVDLRTPTPSAAAIHVYSKISQLIEKLDDHRQSLVRKLQRTFETQQSLLKTYKRHLANLHPQTQIQNLIQRFDEVSERLPRALKSIINQRRAYLAQQIQNCIHLSPLRTIEQQRLVVEKKATQLNHTMTTSFDQYGQRLKHLRIRHEAVSPLSILRRGYSIVTRENGKIVNTANRLRSNEKLHIQFYRGRAKVIVTKTTKEK